MSERDESEAALPEYHQTDPEAQGCAIMDMLREVAADPSPDRHVVLRRAEARAVLAFIDSERSLMFAEGYDAGLSEDAP